MSELPANPSITEQQSTIPEVQVLSVAEIKQKVIEDTEEQTKQSEDRKEQQQQNSDRAFSENLDSTSIHQREACHSGSVETVTNNASSSVALVPITSIGPKLATVATCVAKPTRRWEQWNSAEISAFFEGLKQYGRDFDQVAKGMVRRKLNKDKEQIRNYYFNSLKLLRSTTQIDEDLSKMANVSRDVKELFIVINGLEWKRKVCGKFEAVKLKQLILEGTTIARSKKKKQFVTVRTPFCPSLIKHFPSCKRNAPLPSHLTLFFSPKCEVDRRYVESCGQNPLVRMRLLVGEQLTRIFTVLRTKWTSRLSKLDKQLAKRGNNMKIVLYPDRATRISTLTIKFDETTPTAFCLNRLDKEISQVPPNDSSKQGKVAEVAPSSPNIIPDAKQKTVGATKNVDEVIDNPFIITEAKFLEGLTENTVGEATASELYYLCGKENEINLMYSTGAKPNDDLEPWKLFVNLINRNFGENFAKLMHELERSGGVGSSAATGSVDPNRRESSALDQDASKSPHIVSEPATAKPLCADMVELENNAFVHQLRKLTERKRKMSLLRLRAIKRIVSKSQLTVEHQHMGQPIGEQYQAQQPNADQIQMQQPAVEQYQIQQSSFEEYEIQQSSTEEYQLEQPSVEQYQMQQPSVEQYQMQESGVQQHSMEFVVPHKRLHMASSEEDFDARYLFIRQQEQSSTSTSDVIDALLTADGVASPNASEQSTANSFEKTFAELTAVDTDSVSNTTFFISPLKVGARLPSDVQVSFESMVQTDSVDYCHHFEDLVANIDVSQHGDSRSATQQPEQE